MQNMKMFKEADGCTVVFENVQTDLKNVLCGMFNGAMEKVKDSNKKGEVKEKSPSIEQYLGIQLFQDGDDFIVRLKSGDMNLCTVIKKMFGAIMVDPAQTVALEQPKEYLTAMRPSVEDAEELKKPEDFRVKEERETPETAGEAQRNAVFTTAKGYVGKSPYDILDPESDTDKKRDLGNITYMIRKPGALKGVLYAACVDAVLKYLSKTWGKVEDPFSYAAEVSEEQVKEFFNYYNFVIPSEIKVKISGQAGFKDYKTWLAKSSMKQKRSAMAAIIKYIKEKPSAIF